MRGRPERIVRTFLVITFIQHYGKIILGAILLNQARTTEALVDFTRYLHIFLNGLVRSNFNLEENVKVGLETEINSKLNDNIR